MEATREVTTARHVAALAAEGLPQIRAIARLALTAVTAPGAKPSPADLEHALRAIVDRTDALADDISDAVEG